jgi:hypothetical protein
MRFISFLKNLFTEPHHHKDICNCGHYRKIHGELYLISLVTSPEEMRDGAKLGCYKQPMGKYSFCQCLKFQMDNLGTLENRYDRSLTWKRFLNF